MITETPLRRCVAMVTFRLNGVERTLDADPEMPVLWVLREKFGLTGTKYGCGVAQCGACMIHVDRAPAFACQTFVGDIDGTEIVTIEGVSGKVAETVRQVWTEMDVPQCGYCQSGQVMAAVALLGETPRPDDDDIDSAMSGNLCRCATYHRIRAAIHEAARRLEA
jgi:isoquinoline 1-oxidoreductase alpha subunit